MNYNVGDKVTFRKIDKSGNEIFVTGTIIDAPTMGNITIIEDNTKDEHWITRDSIVGSNGWNTSNQLKPSSDLDRIKKEITRLKASSNCDFLTHRNNNDYAVGYICALSTLENFIVHLEEEK
jgi:hypothetical protein